MFFFSAENNTKITVLLLTLNFFRFTKDFFSVDSGTFQVDTVCRKKSNTPQNNIAIYSASFGPCQPKSSHFSGFFLSLCLLSVIWFGLLC